MGFKLGNTNISDVRLGENQVSKIMLGNQLVWEKFSVDHSLILDMPLTSDFIDRTGNHTLVSTTAQGFPIFEDGSARFNGSKGLKTVENLKIMGGTTATIYLEISLLDLARYRVFFEHGFDIVRNNRFSALIGHSEDKKLSFITLPESTLQTLNDFTLNEFVKCVFTIDLASTSPINMEISGNPSQVIYSTLSSGIFGSQALYIGARNGTSRMINARMKNLKIWNRVLTESEIQSL